MRTITIGRGPHNTVNISTDNLVSRTHCAIICDDYGVIRLVDTQSSNGTVVNGRRMHGKVVLNPGDVVCVGNTIIPWQSYFPANPVSGGPTRIDFASPSPVDMNVSSRDNGNASPNIGGNNVNVNISHPTKEVRPLSDKPNSYMVWAILSIIFCCLPFGIVSVVYASKVDGLWASGDYVGAERAAGKAKLWFWWAFGIGLCLNLIWIIYYVFLGAFLLMI